MADQFLATAFVRIKPDVRGFRTEVEKEVRKAIAGTEKSGALTARVKIVPDIRGFRGLLTAELRKIEGENRVLRVPVIPVVGKTEAAKTGTGGTKKASEDTGKLSATQDKAVQSTNFLTEALRLNQLAATQMSEAFTRASIQLKATEAIQVELAGAQVALKTVEEGLVAAIKSGDAARVRELESTRASLLGVKAEAEAKIKASANEKVLSDLREKTAASLEATNLATQKTLTISAKATALAEAEKTVKAQLSAVEKALATARANNNQELIDALVLEQQTLRTLQERVAAEAEVFTVLTSRSAATETLQKTEAELLVLLESEVGAISEVSVLKELDKEVTKALAAQEEALAVAVELGVAALNEQTTAFRIQGAEVKKAIADREALIRSEARRTASEATALRGARQTGASLLGVRGATLAASDAFLAGAVAVAVFAKAVQAASSLETELNVFQATASATGDEMERVAEEARALGADITLPAVGASDAAQAMTSLAKAGLDVEDSLDGARGVLQLATAAQIENAEATELVASALNAFSLNGTEATRVADLLTGAANEAQGSITDMGIALQQSSAVARQAGLSLEDTVAFITLLAKNGIRGSDAGTSLRTALLRLIAPTEQANKLLRQFGVEVSDAAGNIRPEAFAELQKALSNLDAQARNQVLRKIFGQDAIRAAVIFGREGAAGLNAVREATQEEGLAAKLAEARTKGFAGQVEALKNSIETLGISLGKVTIGPLTSFVSTLQEISDIAGVAAGELDKLGNAARNSGEGGSGGGGFLKGLKDFATQDLGDAIREFRAFLELTGRGRVVKAGQGPLATINAINKEVLETVESGKQLQRVFADVQTPEEAIDKLEQFKDTLIGNSETAQTAREKIDELLDVILALGRAPTVFELAVLLKDNVRTGLRNIQDKVKSTVFEAQIKIASAAAERILLESKLTGQNAADLFIAEFARKLDPAVFAAIMKKFFSDIPTAIQQANDQFDDNFLTKSPAKGLSGEQILNRIAGFDRQKLHAEVTGTTADVIAALKTEQAFLEDQLQRQIVQKNPQLRAKIESALGGVQDELTSIAEDQKQAAEEAADKIKEDRSNAAKALIAGFSSAEQKRLNAETLAAQTEGLRDDLLADQALLRLYQQQKAVALKKLKGTEELAAFLKEQNQKIFQVQQEIKKDQRDIRRQQAQDRRDQADRAIRGIELDIELAEINENTKLEVALRRKLIASLQKRIQLEKGNTNKIKELRNEIARQKQAIKDATQESENRRDAFKSLLFSFLQTQQGFAANLLGNLIPGGAAAGLVGGGFNGGTSGAFTGGIPSGPANAIDDSIRGDRGTRLPFEHGRGRPPGSDLSARAATSGGPTKGGQNRELVLLERIASTLESIRNGNRAPESKSQRDRQFSVMAYEHGHGG